MDVHSIEGGVSAVLRCLPKLKGRQTGSLKLWRMLENAATG